MLAPPPDLDAAGMAAQHCWNWCDGWHPERWPIYDALYPVADWPQLIELMLHIRRTV